MKNLRCVFTDMDGSLLNAEHRISDADLSAIRTLKSKGVYVFLATGRHLLLVKDAAALIGFDLPVCACNGGHIYDFKTQKALSVRAIPPNIAAELYALLSKREFDFVVYTDDRMVFRSSGVRYFQCEELNASFAPENRFTPYFIEDGFDADKEKIIKFLILCNKPQMFAREIAGYLGEGVKNLSISFSAAAFLDINAAGVSKGAALRGLASIFGFRPEDTMAFGDGDNDVEMLRAAGLSVVPQNAGDEIKAIASYVTTANTDSPLSHAVSALFPELLRDAT
jgi:Cof subfamily protein (haloacid dehalogenase superfamily)